MGSPNALAYLASPAVVAFSAIRGFIDYNIVGSGGSIKAEIKTNPKKETSKTAVDIIDGFPESIKGELIFCHQDNMNTDGIYPGKYTYIDDFTPEQQAAVLWKTTILNLGK